MSVSASVCVFVPADYGDGGSDSGKESPRPLFLLACCLPQRSLPSTSTKPPFSRRIPMFLAPHHSLPPTCISSSAPRSCSCTGTASSWPLHPHCAHKRAELPPPNRSPSIWPCFEAPTSLRMHLATLPLPLHSTRPFSCGPGSCCYDSREEFPAHTLVEAAGAAGTAFGQNCSAAPCAQVGGDRELDAILRRERKPEHIEAERTVYYLEKARLR